MTSDGELRHAFDALGDRLRDAVVREVQETKAQVVALAQLRGTEQKADAVRILDAFRTIDAASSLTGALDALVDAVASDQTRVVVLLRRGTRLRVWRLRGVDASTLSESAALTLDQAGPIGEAIRERRALSRSGADAPLPMMVESEREWIVVPIVLAAEAVAVLYADRRISDAEHSSWFEGVELLVRHAAKALETLAAFKTATMMAAANTRVAPAMKRSARQVS